eukprot:UN33132
MVYSAKGFTPNREMMAWGQNLFMWSNEMRPPTEEDSFVRPANDDIIRQTLGSGILGVMAAAVYTNLAAQNSMVEFGKYQGAFWHPHKWTTSPGAHPYLMLYRNTFTLGGMAATFAFADASLARIRQVEDPFNAMFGGLAAGCFLGCLRGIYQGYIMFSVYGLCFIALKRFGMNEDCAGKAKFDENKHLFGT